MWGGRKCEDVKHDQYVIEMLNIIKVVVFKFYGNKELNQAMWEACVSVFQCRQQKF